MKKEKIYLIPGLMTDERLWHRLEPHLQEEYELIHTPIPAHENFDEIIEHIDAQIPCDKINLLGFSLGGYIASYYAIKKPQKVNRLFLVGSTPSATEQKDIKRRESKLQEARNNKFTRLSLEKARELLEQKEDEKLAHIMKDMFNDLGHHHFVPQLASTLNRVDLYEDLKTLQMPIKFFYSKEDRLLNHSSLEALENSKHPFKLVCREGNSHNIPLEVPEDLSTHIKDWMNH